MVRRWNIISFVFLEICLSNVHVARKMIDMGEYDSKSSSKQCLLLSNHIPNDGECMSIFFACFGVLLLVVGWFTGARAIPLIGGGVPWLIAQSLPQLQLQPQLQQQNQPSADSRALSLLRSSSKTVKSLDKKASEHMHCAYHATKSLKSVNDIFCWSVLLPRF